MHSAVYEHQAFTMQCYCGISRYLVGLVCALNRLPGFSSSIVAPLHLNYYLSRSGLPSPHCFAGASFRAAERRRALANRSLFPLAVKLLVADLAHATHYWPTTRRLGSPLERRPSKNSSIGWCMLATARAARYRGIFFALTTRLFPYGAVMTR